MLYTAAYKCDNKKVQSIKEDELIEIKYNLYGIQSYAIIPA